MENGRAFLVLAACGGVLALMATAGAGRDPAPPAPTRDVRPAPAGAALPAESRLELDEGRAPDATRALVAESGAASGADSPPAGEAADPEPSDGTADPAGMTDGDRLIALQRAHGMIALAAELPDPALVERAELNFIRRCVGTILHDRGRARFPDDEVRERGGFRLGPSENGEFSFLQDGALYQYDRGEFPVHDVAFDRRYGKPVERPADMEERIHALMLEALDTLERR